MGAGARSITEALERTMQDEAEAFWSRRASAGDSFDAESRTGKGSECAMRLERERYGVCHDAIWKDCLCETEVTGLKDRARVASLYGLDVRPARPKSLGLSYHKEAA